LQRIDAAVIYVIAPVRSTGFVSTKIAFVAGGDENRPIWPCDPPMLRTLVYVSTATSLLSDAELETLLGKARALNKPSGVTGALLYSDGNFMQCLEGPTDAIDAAYARICASGRHKDVIVLLDEPISRRSFGTFEMGLARPTAVELLKLSTANWRSVATASDQSLPMSAGFELLQNFWASWQH
jgi:hypothetical protein